MILPSEDLILDLNAKTPSKYEVEAMVDQVLVVMTFKTFGKADAFYQFATHFKGHYIKLVNIKVKK